MSGYAQASSHLKHFFFFTRKAKLDESAVHRLPNEFVHWLKEKSVVRA